MITITRWDDGNTQRINGTLLTKHKSCVHKYHNQTV